MGTVGLRRVQPLYLLAAVVALAALLAVAAFSLLPIRFQPEAAPATAVQPAPVAVRDFSDEALAASPVVENAAEQLLPVAAAERTLAARRDTPVAGDYASDVPPPFTAALAHYFAAADEYYYAIANARVGLRGTKISDHLDAAIAHLDRAARWLASAHANGLPGFDPGEAERMLELSRTASGQLARVPVVTADGGIYDEVHVRGMLIPLPAMVELMSKVYDSYEEITGLFGAIQADGFPTQRDRTFVTNYQVAVSEGLFALYNAGRVLRVQYPLPH